MLNERVNFISVCVFILVNTHLFCTATPSFDGERAFEYLVKQCDFGPRNPGSAGHQQCKSYLMEVLKQHADQVTVQTFMFSFGKPAQTAIGYNIIARFSPETKNRAMLCAHWDTRPWADEDPDVSNHNKPVLGANDGASGVAVLLHMAELIAQVPPPIGIDIVLFDAEDAGRHNDTRSWAQGSSAFASQLTADLPVYAILLDMIGDADLEIYQDAYSSQFAPQLMNRIWSKAAELGFHEFIPSVGYIVYDDHVPLLEAGIPSVDLIDFDYPYWHTIQDTPDKCSPESLEKVGRVVIEIIYSE